jgi:hypothetical protein
VDGERRERGRDQRAWKAEGKKQQRSMMRRATVVVREAVVEVVVGDGIYLWILYEVDGGVKLDVISRDGAGNINSIDIRGASKVL